MINRDSDGSGELDAQTGGFDFLEGEASSVSDSMVIPDGGASNNGSQQIQRSRGNGGSSSSSCLKSSALSGSLIEPNSDVGLPVLSQMDVGDDVVVLDHLSQKIIIINKIGK